MCTALLQVKEYLEFPLRIISKSLGISQSIFSQNRKIKRYINILGHLQGNITFDFF